MRNFFHLVFIIILFLWGNQTVFAQSDTLEIEKAPYERSLTPYLQAFQARNDTFTLEEVKANSQLFDTFHEDMIPAGTSHWWIKFYVHNKSDQLQNLLLGTSQYDYIDFYLPDAKGKYHLTKGGSLFPNQSKAFVFRANSYAPLTLKQNQTAECYIKISSIDKPAFEFETIPLQLSISAKKAVIADKDHRNILLYFLSGAVFIMLIYNFFLFLMIRDTGYLYYALLTVLIFVFAFMLSGKFIEMADNTSGFEKLLRYAGVASFVGYLLFSRKIMDLKNRKPKTYFYSNIVLALFLVDFPLTYFNLMVVTVPLSMVAATGTYGIAIISAIKLTLKENHLPAKFFLLGNSFSVLFTLIAILQMLSLLPVTLLGLKASSFFMIGMIIELALFSLSLGAKINEAKAQVIQKELEKERLLRDEEEKRTLLIQQQNEELEQKVALRTLEIQERNKEIQERNEEIEQQNEELATQADALMKANYLLNTQNTRIISSLNYAKRIQTAMLPEKPEIENEHRFVFFRPQSVVSGDFYYYFKQDKIEVIAAVDCTGHGVPGAFISLIGNQLLSECIEIRQEFSPEKILTYLQKGINKTLKQKDNGNRDGMDVAIVVIDHIRKVMEFSGAKNPLFYFQKGEAHLIKGDRSNIGGHQPGNGFTKYSIPLDSPTIFYIYTDGFQDQFGGPFKKKYMSKKFRAFLEEIHLLSAPHQKNRLQKELENWQEDNQQTDDILVIGGYIA